jgi:hypothetical protein
MSFLSKLYSCNSNTQIDRYDDIAVGPFEMPGLIPKVLTCIRDLPQRNVS